MRSPSSRALINRCDIYAAAPSQDADGGAQYAYPAIPTLAGVACSAQPVETQEIVEQDRLIRETRWKVMLPSAASVKNRDKLVITTPAGNRHTAFVHIKQDQAGRGAAYVIHAVERT